MPEFALEATSYLRALDIEPPVTLSTEDAWKRLAATVVAMRAEIRAAGSERIALIEAAAEERRQRGQFQSFPYEGRPTRNDPDWRKKWPWLEESPGEARQTRTSTNGSHSVIEVISIMPGEVPRIDEAEARIQNLTLLLRSDIAGFH